MYQVNFDIADFLTNYWQKKPVVIKQAFKDFHDPISAEELAGLACEEEVASRVILTEQNQWQIIPGPIEDYSAYGEQDWQLLVQAVNHWFPDSIALVEAFRFIPDWRFDDLMVSFATPGGGVGPHIDNYDVFLLQGSGSRRWKVGDIGHYRPRNGDTHTALIDDFDPMLEVTLEKGDMLYIPPGFPHCAKTLSTALSYSIGFRAPSQQELFSSLADQLIDQNTGLKRFTSNGEPTSPSCVSTAQQQGLQAMLAELIANETTMQPILGQLLSQNRFELDLCPADEPYTSEMLIEDIGHGAQLCRVGGLKIIQLEADPLNRLFIDGQSHTLPAHLQPLATLLSDNIHLSQAQTSTLLAEPEFVTLIVELINSGHMYLAE
ncbi:cupin domain-containing protein [Shewanella sp. Scap07]|uniref:ribosomal protein uL16 3-hydroxylase n=1 Tax=Shewanella sp. Scap07 TaxID=2589987 RepID=UPI0015B828B6|nr:cupin domain-containing protein [Shewanella sp. Scap07]QLE85832.1 cupin domain-containing protein [Shewanella sp. Scap07]